MGKSARRPLAQYVYPGYFSSQLAQRKKLRSNFSLSGNKAIRGLGVVSLNGKMIDGPIIDHARKVVALSASGIRD